MSVIKVRFWTKPWDPIPQLTGVVGPTATTTRQPPDVGVLSDATFSKNIYFLCQFCTKNTKMHNKCNVTCQTLILRLAGPGWAYITALPAIAALALGHNYICTHNIGLQCKQNVVVCPAPLSLSDRHTITSRYDGPLVPARDTVSLTWQLTKCPWRNETVCTRFHSRAGHCSKIHWFWLWPEINTVDVRKGKGGGCVGAVR